MPNVILNTHKPPSLMPTVILNLFQDLSAERDKKGSQ